LYGTDPSAYPETTAQLNSMFPHGYTESTAGLFDVTGSGTTQFTIKYASQDGAYNFSVGYFIYNGTLPSNTASASSLESWAYNTVAGGKELFDERTSSPGATATINLPAGSVIGFYLIPNDTLADFLANGKNYNPFTSSAWPLFSIAGANPNSSDQAMVFSSGTSAMGNNGVLLSWEDMLRLTPNSQSDSDFNDLILTANCLQPVPEPSTYALASAGLLALLLAGYRIRQHKKSKHV
jgi:hypothetical protein